MVGLALKILGVGLAGSALSYGAYLGIEDMKGKASIDYPAYYGNKHYKASGGEIDEDNSFLKYEDEEKGKFLYNKKNHSSISQYQQSKDRFSNLGEDGQKYRQGCIVTLREFVMNGKGDRNILNNNCVFDYSLRKEFSGNK